MQKEYVGKSLEEALETAAAELGFPKEELKYQKISENGILFKKKVKILVNVPEAEAAPAPAVVQEAPVIEEESTVSEAVNETEAESESVNIASDIVDAVSTGSTFPKSDKPAEEIAKNFVSEVLAGMGINAIVTSELDTEEETIYVNIEGPDMGVLIGKRGQTLDSLQYLTSLVVNRQSESDYLKVKLDTENYRARRKETLENLAKNIAGKVKRTRRAVALEPMNPYERRIIHSTLQGDKYVETHSEGEDPYRKVVITMRKDAPRDNRYRDRRGGGYGNKGGYGGRKGGYNNNRGGYGKKKIYPRHNEQSDDYSQDYKADYAAYLEQKAAERAASDNNNSGSGNSSLF